jgi:hypothetical protein
MEIKQSTRPRSAQSITAREFEKAADTLESLLKHNFEVPAMIREAQENRVCTLSEHYERVSDQQGERLRYKHELQPWEVPSVSRQANNLWELAGIFVNQVVDEQLRGLREVSRQISRRDLRTSKQFKQCIAALAKAALSSSGENGSVQNTLKNNIDGVKEIIARFRNLASDSTISGERNATTPPPATTKARPTRQRPKLPRLGSAGARPSSSPETTIQLTNKTISTSTQSAVPGAAAVFSQETTADEVKFFQQCLESAFGVDQVHAINLAEMFSSDTMDNLLRAFEYIEQSLRVQLGKQHPNIFHPTEGAPWPTYVNFLQQATKLAGGVDQVILKIDKMGTASDLQELVKELLRELKQEPQG